MVTHRAVPALPLLLLFCTLWRVPSLADPPWLNDEGTYATLGRAIAGGELLYRQIWENKPPAIYLLYGTIDRLTGPAHLLTGARLAALLAALAIQIAVYAQARRRSGRPTALLSAAFAGALVDLPIIDGTSANAEIFLAACTSVGMALLWRSIAPTSADDDRRPRAPKRRGHPGAPTIEPHGPASETTDRGPTHSAGPAPGGSSNPPLLLAGILFGVAALFKLVAGADLIAALLIILYPRSGASTRRRLAGAATVLGGATLPVAAVAGWLAARGLLSDAFYATIGYNRGYVGAGQSLHAPLITTLSLAAPLALLVLSALLAMRAPRAPTPPVGATIALWLGLALLGADASGRAYPHYYLQVAPPLALACAGLVAAGAPRIAMRALAALLALWAVALPAASWAAYRAQPAHARPGSVPLAYYAHAWQRLTGGLGETAYGNALDPRVERNLALIDYLAAHPAAPRRLYIWGNIPWVYYLSGYEHAARFVSAFYNPPIPGGPGSVRAAIRRDPPPYLIVVEPPTPVDPALAGFIRARYRPVRRIENAVVYRLRG